VTSEDRQRRYLGIAGALRIASISIVIAAVSCGLFQKQNDNWKLCNSDDPTTAIKGCTEIIDSRKESDAKLARALKQRAGAYMKDKRYKGAIHDYDQVIKITPSDARAFQDRGRAYIADGEYDLAMEDLDQGIQLDSDDANLFIDRAVVYDKTGKRSRGIEDYDRAISLDGGSALAFGNRGNDYLGEDNYGAAIRDCGHSISLSPSPFAYACRGAAYYFTHEYDRAIRDLNDAISRDPENWYAFKFRGRCYFAEDDYQTAIRNYDEAIRLKADDSGNWSARCFARAVIGQVDDTIKDCNHALPILPGDPFALDSRGFIYLKMKEYVEAKDDYNAALRVSAQAASSPQTASSLYGRGLSEHASGDAGGGEEDMRAATQLDPHIGDKFKKYGIEEDPGQ